MRVTLQGLAKEVKNLQEPLPVILEAGFVNGLGVVRDLGKIGIQSLALSSKPDGIGLFSKYTWGLSCPDPAADPGGLKDLLIQIGELLSQKGVLLVTDDTYLKVLNRFRNELSKYYIFTFPEAGILNRVMDKMTQVSTARQCGVPVPNTMVLKGGLDVENWPSDAFPAVVKGQSGKDFQREAGKQVLVVNSKTELEEVYQCFGAFGLIIQEIIPGGDDQLYTCGSYIRPDGEVQAVFSGRKLKQRPANFGVCCVGESVQCPEVVNYSLKLLRCLDFYGVSQVEFKYDARDKQYKLIEINGRFWMWHSLSSHCGVNLSAVAYHDAAGLKKLEISPQRYGPKWILLTYKLLSLPKQILHGKLQLGEWVSYFFSPHIHAMFSVRDIMPGFMFYITKFSPKKISRGFKKILNKKS